MSGFDRFAEFLRREAKGYNEAPGVPREVMWRGVEAGLGEVESEGVADGEMQGVVGVGQVAGSDRVVGGRAVGAMGYNEAPRAPREEMWGRIEAAWGMRGGGGGRAGVEAEADGVAGPPAEPFR
ncbi:MAG: hypothetical protein OXI71_00390, partial [Gemmatimonadota bacterium]|nr:hypothetical protein [Gemmatimonadota bacterium]